VRESGCFRTYRKRDASILPSMAAQARRILVAFDGSEASYRALDVAARLTGYGSTLAVVSVGRDRNGTVQALLADAHERLLGQQVTATYLERAGDPADEIVQAARALEADLVVVGRRGGGVGTEPLPGSVSAGVVREASCDVLVVR
jgi:nucleotide-binding universal stress UspA family protein